MPSAFQTLDASFVPHSRFARIETPQQLGAMLRDARFSQEIQIADIAAKLRLKSNFIDALEKGNWDELPSETYARGYLRQYAQHLGLSVEEVTACCQRMQGKVDPKLNYMHIASANDGAPSKISLWLSGFAIALCLVGWQGYQSVQSTLVTAPISLPEERAISSLSSLSTDSVSAQLAALACLNIPAKAILPCGVAAATAPSFLLKTSTIYPIWIR